MLEEPAKALGGELYSSSREGEDLSEAIIDGEARLKARLLLRDKLTAILQTNRGSVDELIKAERAVADVNEVIDATASKLEQNRNRIRYSEVKVRYEVTGGSVRMGFARPISEAVRSIGSTLGLSISVVIYILTALLPVALLVLALRWLFGRFGWRLPRRRRPVAEAAAPAD